MSDDLDDAYTEALAASLPEGPAWDGYRLPGTGARNLLEAKASAYAAVHRHFAALLAEALPWRARTMLAEREVEAGLPDACSKGRATTLQERQQAIGARWAGTRFPHTTAGFTDLAASLGYQVVVDVQPPFRSGQSRCGVAPLNPTTAALVLRMRVTGPRRTRFRCGLSQAGKDPLLKIQRAEDLECVVRRRTHSHVTVIFNYEGD